MTSRLSRALACAALLATSAILLGGCGSGGSSASPDASTSPSADASQVVPKSMTDAIIKGAFDAGSMTLVRAAAVESVDEPDYYFVALRFDGPEGEQVGVWATKYLDASGMVWAVNDVARTTTEWPPSDSGGVTLIMETQGAQAAADAVR